MAGLPVLVGTAAALLTLLPGWAILEGRAWDLLSRLRPPPAALAEDIVLVDIDEPSFAELQLRWPWPREIHAELLSALREAGARAVAFDIVFAEPGPPDGDAALAEAIALHRPILLAADEAALSGRQVDGRMLVEPLPEFLEAGAIAGNARVRLDPDGVVRRLPAGPESFALRLAQTASKGPPGDPAAQVLLRWFPHRTDIARVSYYQALRPAEFLSPGKLDGKIIIVGLDVASSPDPDRLLPDTFLTPLTLTDGRQASGAEIQATAYLNIVNGLWIVPVHEGSILAALAFALLWARLMLTPWTPMRAAGVLVSTGGIMVAASLGLLELARLWFAPVLPILGTVLFVIATGAAAILTERRERRYIRNAFARYLAPELVEQLASHPEALRLGGERREMTFLFSDIRGFTTLSEQLEADPERLTRLINRFLTALSRVVHAHGGTIDKYMGDCIMAFWGAPLRNVEHALHAGRAALAMRSALDELNREFALNEPDLPALKAGIGVNTGPAVVGNIGSEVRFAYSVLGDAVNLASRLEGLTKAMSVDVLLGVTTAVAIGDRLALLPLERIAVRGKTRPTTVYTLLGDASLAADPRFLRLRELSQRLLEARPATT